MLKNGRHKSVENVRTTLLFILTIALRCQTRRIEVNKYLIGCVENGPLKHPLIEYIGNPSFVLESLTGEFQYLFYPPHNYRHSD